MSLLKDRGFVIAFIITILIGFSAYWMILESIESNQKEVEIRASKNRKSFESMNSASRKLDAAIKEAELMNLLLDEIKKDLEEIHNNLKEIKRKDEEEAGKR